MQPRLLVSKGNVQTVLWTHMQAVGHCRHTTVKLTLPH